MTELDHISERFRNQVKAARTWDDVIRGDAPVSTMGLQVSHLSGIFEEFATAVDAALATARREALEEAAKAAEEYLWDDHALAQATPIGKACHYQAAEIVEAIRALLHALYERQQDKEG